MGSVKATRSHCIFDCIKQMLITLISIQTILDFKSRFLCFIAPCIKTAAVLIATRAIPPEAIDEAKPLEANTTDNEFPMSFNFL